MRIDTERAKSLLIGKLTCVLVHGEEVVTSEKNGIAPMADFLSEGRRFEGYSVADRIVGKAAAMLFAKAGITEVYAEVMSESGKAWLEKCGISATWGTLTPCIINRRGDGPCPMERAVEQIDDTDTGVQILLLKLNEMRKRI